MRTFFRRLIRLLIKIITEVFKIMKLPVLNRKAAGELKIADFSGGVNLRDGLSEIMDNQATDVKNMWWKDGIMKTRPADRSVYKIPHDGFKPFIAGQTFTNSKAENATKMIDGRLYNMVSRHDSYYSKVVSEEPWKPEQSHISFAWVNGEKNYPLPSITTGENTAAINYFAVQHKKDIYCFVYLEDYGGDKSGVIYRLADDESGWSIVPEEDIYAPVVMTHARPQRDIVTGFNTEPAEVRAGSNFKLIVHLKNTSSKTAVSNMLFDMQAPSSGSEGAAEAPAFLPASGSSSVYLDGISAGGTSDISIELKARADLVKKPYSISMSMKYEDSSAAQYEAQSSLAIPVIQDARFEFSKIEIAPETVAVGEEANISCSLYNLGRVKMYNVKARFEGDEKGDR